MLHNAQLHPSGHTQVGRHFLCQAKGATSHLESPMLRMVPTLHSTVNRLTVPT